MIKEFNGKAPKIHPTAFVAPNAVIIGDVEIGPDASIWYNVVIRADVNKITIGARTNIQDGSVLHVDADAPCTLGDDVTVGHMALVHGAMVGNGTLVGMKSALLSRSVIGEGSLIAAGAIVLEGQTIPERTLAAGIPAKVKRDNEREFISHAAKYVALSKEHQN
ncbi:gamma carbonic anhydrase family protein [Corynebacterium epidermidicanis]|uniref:Isoleucine patch superfamily enzyme, carbonic anhydrase/acetyltransferase n=1 Tax=Corynebacterium epidermidicanis TaxID=1050174 RepID=A0A0G3GLK2_9CORY|nr:gamma carbonic anhydrase family protein [Corynebacterium epidermidicanis]AKK02049.1 isoleucine patch superfamily enzyme, carbonic anhydrase/acetyltransferase [Corynebacterium epidermidicanis]